MVSRVSEHLDWTGKSVLVTGATGFIGQRLVKQLVNAGAHVYACTAPTDPEDLVAALPIQVEKLAFDIRDKETMATAITQATPQFVFHLAAVGVTTPNPDPDLALSVNAGGAINLLQILRESEVQRIVLTGTCYEYGARETNVGLDPLSLYAASKVAAWAFGRAYWRVYGTPVVTVRPFQVYGPGQAACTLIPAAIRAALAGDDFPMTPGEQARDFIYVDDIVAGFLAAARAPDAIGKSLDLGTGTARPIREVVELVWHLTASTGKIQAGALPYRPAEVMHIAADAARTARLTGWRAQIDLTEGLKRTIEAIRDK